MTTKDTGGSGHHFQFDDAGDFAALNAAQKWCRDHGISYGSLQRDDPVGLMVGDHDIDKWRNLSLADRQQLDGQLTGDKRNGPVFITLARHVQLAARTPEAE